MAERSGTMVGREQRRAGVGGLLLVALRRAGLEGPVAAWRVGPQHTILLGSPPPHMNESRVCFACVERAGSSVC